MALLLCPSGNENYRSQRPNMNGWSLNVAMPIKIPFSEADILRVPLAVGGENFHSFLFTFVRLSLTLYTGYS